VSDATLFRGGPVFTGRRYVEALLVDDGTVVAAGSAEDVARQAPTGAERRSLAGSLLVPGLVDAHLHVAELARTWEGLDLSEASSVDDLLRRVRAWGEAHPAGPIVGRGFDPERFPDRRWPTVRELDAAEPDRPVAVYHASGHAAAVNSPALGRAQGAGGGSRSAHGIVGTFPDGTPNGLLYEEALEGISALREEGAPVTAEALERTLCRLVGMGLVAVGAMSLVPEGARGLQALASHGRLPLVVRGYLRLGLLDEFSAEDLGAPGGRFRIVGAKAFLDGAFGPRTASLSSPYDDDPSTSGLDVGTDDELSAEIDRAARQGLAPALHAIGDRAVERATRLLATRKDRPGLPGRIEHASLTPARLLPRLEEARPTLVVQPGFVWSDRWLPARLGRERARDAYAFRTLRSRGIRVAGSSDAPYDPPDPWRGLRAAVARRAPGGGSANPDPSEALPAEEAISLYTSEARAALGLPGGTLEPGEPADLLVLSVRSLAEALARGSGAVRETWIGGRPASLPLPTGKTV
jgi:predicted amidohydrolase YtcJ